MDTAQTQTAGSFAGETRADAFFFQHSKFLRNHFRHSGASSSSSSSEAPLANTDLQKLGHNDRRPVDADQHGESITTDEAEETYHDVPTPPSGTGREERDLENDPVEQRVHERNVVTQAPEEPHTLHAIGESAHGLVHDVVTDPTAETSRKHDS